MPQSSMAQAVCDRATLRCMGKGGGVRRCGTFEALQPHPHAVQLNSGMEFGVGSGWCLAGQSLIGSQQEFELYPADIRRLSAEKEVGVRKDPCDGGFKNGRGPLWSPRHMVMVGDFGSLGGRFW